MNRTIFFALLILSLVLSACGSRSDQLVETQPSGDQPGGNEPSYPPPSVVNYPTVTPWYPAPGTPGAPAPGQQIISGYEPRPEDVNLTRGEVFLNLENSELVLMESMPLQVTAALVGDLPDPCHLLRVVVTPANEQNQVNLEVYSLVNPGTICTTVLSPFQARISLGSYSGGHFQVFVNGELLGEFDS